jgi:transposase-like protein
MKEKVSAENRVREIRRKTRKKYSSEEKVRIVLEGLRGEASIAELCRREGIPSAGTYTIEATSFSSAETGTYSLTLMRVDAISSAIASPSGNGNAKPEPCVKGVEAPEKKDLRPEPRKTP